jgi:hypothetical protein
MSDIVERLREAWGATPKEAGLLSEAASEIQRLREVKRRALRIADERSKEANELRAQLQSQPESAGGDARRPQDWIVQALDGFFAEFGDNLPEQAKAALAAKMTLACAGIQGEVETEPFYRLLSACSAR